MRFELIEELSQEPERVYEILWRRFTDLPRYIPSLAAIEPIESREVGERHERTLHRWVTDPKTIPAFARRFVYDYVKEWIGTANWYHGDRRVCFDFQNEVLGDLYNCTGEFLVVPSPSGGTQIVIQAVLDVYPEKLPGVPRWLGRRTAPLVEEAVVNLIRPSLAALPKAVGEYL